MGKIKEGEARSVHGDTVVFTGLYFHRIGKWQIEVEAASITLSIRVLLGMDTHELAELLVGG